MSDKHKVRIRAPQQRQIERVNIILDCALDILQSKSIDELSLAEISEKTEIVLPSIYYYFANKNALIGALANRIHEHWIAKIELIHNSIPDCWTELIEIIVQRGAEYLNNNPSVMQLLLGVASPVEARRADMNANNNLAKQICVLLEKHYWGIDSEYLLPKAEIAVAILDGIWRYSYNVNERIHEDVVEEAKQALICYLRTYLPQRLKKI
ncbi:TetR/AcrR family transcriptional regulator [Acinetobacter baumannii]|uniref:TetR/AcrR family transcriptional regulator n=1 Tax=Acinetobacter baumannii TaxID=470 RepID=UPI002448DF16|nr:TetR/AcrR family transcriptional regulator [Acinetobacter baumannii]MDH2528295.1 TetR/AcrR family transcriptional regulator [Acinetobacter baumannii]